MATDIAPQEVQHSDTPRSHGTEPLLPPLVWAGLEALASLKLTVVLFLLAIVLVYAGTLAQVEMDVWDVVHDYFRSYFVLIPFQVFFPSTFFPGLANKIPGVLPFPGGWTIGSAMAVNLLAAHAIRFKVQARGARLLGGILVVALGLLSFVLAVRSGMSSDGILQPSLIPWVPLWRMFVATLVLVCTAMAYGVFQMDPERYRERLLLGAATVLLGGISVWLVYNGDTARLGDSGMRILWQLLKGEGVALVLLAGCYLLFKKRAGVVLLHGGVALVMASELIVSFWAVEGQMRIREGESVNFVSDIRTVELAVTDRSNPEHDVIVSIPKPLLTEDGRRIADDRLPFDIEVVKFYENSDLVKAGTEKENPANKGTGLAMAVVPARFVSGTMTTKQINVPSAYVKLTDKKTKADLGTYLVSLWASMNEVSEKVPVDGKSYEMELRHRRTYKPYSFTLLDFRKDDYVGTTTPKNFSSDIYLLDPSRQVDRDSVHISMNNPLRFADETFYQSEFAIDPKSGAEVTVLSVVSNFGWMIPYVGCMVVGTGMFFQFVNTLSRFLSRMDRQVVSPKFPTPRAAVDAETRQQRRRERELSTAAFADTRRRSAGVWAATATVLLATIWVSYAAMKPVKRFEQMDLGAFGQLPVAHEGRVKPMDTLARNMMRVLSGKAEFADDNKVKQPAIRWLADLIGRPDEAAKHKVFLIHQQDLLNELGLPRREKHLYSLAEFEAKFPVLEEQARAAIEQRRKAPETLSAYQRQVIELWNKLGEVIALQQAFTPTVLRPDHLQEDAAVAMRREEFLQSGMPPLAIPPVEEKGRWSAYSTSTLQKSVITQHGGENSPFGDVKIHPGVDHWSKILFAYSKGDSAEFNREVAAYQNVLAAEPPPEFGARRVSFEAFFNRAEPFYYAAVLYLAVFLLAVAGWIFAPQVLQRSAFWLLLFTLGFHTLALIGRIYISGRPPVTNLYSSAVFIGWGCVALAIGLEAIYRLGIGSAVAGFSGFMTLLIAHFLSLDGDTISVMQAVLDTQFWLATHVVTVALGYSTTFLAGLYGIAYIGLGLFSHKLDRETSKRLAGSIYGILCFAIFFSFVGTVLGGLWADDSWGRFWGWDPKENGALIIVLWNAVVLHARWGKMVGDRGMAVLAVLGNICTCWSWFGVNQLGVGLHSYGFTDGVLMWLGVAAGTHLAIACVGAFVPTRLWMSGPGAPENPSTATLVNE